MKWLRQVSLIATLASLVGCEDITEQFGDTPKPKQQEQRTSSPTHRFVLTTRDVDLTFDTPTGQLCKTWGWTPVAPPEKPASGTGIIPERKPGEFAPTCLALFQQYPTKNEPNDSVVLSQDSNPN
jgi:hypothetical protein